MAEVTFPTVSGSLLVSCMRNEGSSALEWFAYHRLIGFENFLIYTNDCQDGTDAIWERLTWLGKAVHRGNPERPGSSAPAQKRALAIVNDDPVYRSSEWVMFLDADEFLNILSGDGSLNHLMSLNEASDCIFLNWKLFGTSGRTRYDAGLLLEQYLRANDPARPVSRADQSPKSLFRRKLFLRPGIHRPHPQDWDTPVVYSRPSGKPVGRRWNFIIRRAEYDTAQINHYATQSLESVLMKVHRGRGAKLARRSAVEYLKEMDRNQAEDVSIQRHLPALKAELARLLEDPVLARLQREAEEWRYETVRRILDDPAVQADFEALSMQSEAT